MATVNKKNAAAGKTATKTIGKAAPKVATDTDVKRDVDALAENADVTVGEITETATIDNTATSSDGVKGTEPSEVTEDDKIVNKVMAEIADSSMNPANSIDGDPVAAVEKLKDTLADVEKAEKILEKRIEDGESKVGTKSDEIIENLKFFGARFWNGVSDGWNE